MLSGPDRASPLPIVDRSWPVPQCLTIHYCIDRRQKAAHNHTVLYGDISMRDLILQCAGVAGIAVALIHGVLGETKVFARATIQPESLRTLIRLVWQAGTVAWIGGGVLLIAAPSFGSESARHWIVVTIVAVYAFAAAANAWWSRGRGFGWKALGAVVVLAVAGY